MKQILFVLMICISFAANAQGAPKMLVCIEMAFVAGEAFETKNQNKKVSYPVIQNKVERSLTHRAIWVGMRSKSYQEAVQRGHDSCVNSKVWAEINN